jgi:hypothetical protein
MEAHRASYNNTNREGQMDTTTYRGIVMDRMDNNRIVYASRNCTTYYEAHTRAEKHARGDRYTVDVAQSDRHEYINSAIANR